jgi:hypothetical protein
MSSWAGRFVGFVARTHVAASSKRQGRQATLILERGMRRLVQGGRNEGTAAGESAAFEFEEGRWTQETTRMCIRLLTSMITSRPLYAICLINY